MNEDARGGRDNQPVRVIDRRMFTPEGERREPDLAREEPVVPAPPTPITTTKEPTRSGAQAADPVSSAHFQNLVVNLARQAAANLGAARHPLTGQIEVDLEGAQQMIDLLQALRQKTQGNLATDEKELLEGLIGELQMQYVSVRSKASAKP
jgi:hypothetical protein